MQHLKRFNKNKFEGLEKDEQEFKDSGNIYLAKAWARHYINNATGKLSEKVELAHKIKIQAINSGIPEVVKLANNVGIEYGKIKNNYLNNKDDIYRSFICKDFFKATDVLIDKLRTI